MVAFEEALGIVSEYDAEFDYCVEYADAFVFSKKDDFSFGGQNSPAAVMKENGRCINFIEYIDESDCEEIRKGFIEDWIQGKVA